MTEKERFEMEEDSTYIIDNKTNERALYLYDWLNKLNDLNDENEELKQEITEFNQLIPIDKIKETVRDGSGRVVGVYYND